MNREESLMAAAAMGLRTMGADVRSGLNVMTGDLTLTYHISRMALHAAREPYDLVFRVTRATPPQDAMGFYGKWRRWGRPSC